jgi:hypothetical protein
MPAILAGTDWDKNASAADQKTPATFHTKKKSKRLLKFLQKALFWPFCMGDCKSPCDQHRIATMASPPLHLGFFKKIFFS